MTEVNRSILVPHSASKMFSLVNDVHSYPEFLPWCAKAEVLSESEKTMEAVLTLQKGALSYKLVTKNSITPNETIQMKLVKGPFKTLDGIWKFTQISNCSTRVEFHLNFTLSSPLIKMTLGKVLDSAMTNLVDAFCKRANELYGKKCINQN